MTLFRGLFDGMHSIAPRSASAKVRNNHMIGIGLSFIQIRLA